MSFIATLAVIDELTTVLVGALNAVNATQPISDAIAKRIAEGRKDFTPEERKAFNDALAAAEAKSDAQIKAAGG